MKQSKNFDLVKKHYIDGSWDDTRLNRALEKGWITKEEYNLIKQDFH